MGISLFKVSSEKVTLCKGLLVGMWAQRAGDTSASFALDVFLQVFGFQIQQCVTVRKHREQGKLQLHVRWMCFCIFSALKASNALQ